MINVKWDLDGFSVFYSDKFQNFEDVERNIASLSGISNFSGLEGDWFLVERKSKALGFMLLDIPSSIERIKNGGVDLDGLREVSMMDFIDLADFTLCGIPSAYFCDSKDQIIVLDRSDVEYKVVIGLDFYILLNSQRKRCGFLMCNAMKHIAVRSERLDDGIFHELLMGMLDFCNEEKYKLMDDQDEQCLHQLIALERRCIDSENKDGRIFHILEFVRRSKNTFYDIEE
jgi:hypothetical protein